jgi:hypothetical protein
MRGLLAIALCCLASTAHADKSRAERADELFKTGKRLLAQNKYAEACTAFEESDRIDPGIGAKLNVARCYQEWGKPATAWRWYRDAEQMATTAGDERTQKIHALIEELETSVPRLTVKAPAGADLAGVVIELDGVALAASALGVERRVDPGPHRVDTIVDGARRSKVVPIERGGSAEVMLELPAQRDNAGPPRAAGSPGIAAAPTERPGRTRRIVGLSLTGGGALAMGIAGIVTLRAHSDYEHALTSYCQGVTDMCDDTGLARTHSARDHANSATAVVVIGLAAIGAGLYLYFTAPETQRPAGHAMYLAPRIDGDGGTVVLGGAF